MCPFPKAFTRSVVETAEAMVVVLQSAPRPWTSPPSISNLCPWKDLALLHTGPASQQKGPLYVVARRREVRRAIVTTSG